MVPKIAARSKELEYECEFCGAKKGELCRTNGWIAAFFHETRKEKVARKFLFHEIGNGTEFRFLPTDLEVWWKKTSADTANLLAGHNSMICDPNDEVEVR